MTTNTKASGWKVAAIVIASLLAAVILMIVLGVGLMAVTFAILPGTAFTNCEVTVVLRDADGNPLADQEVDLWSYDSQTYQGKTDAQGQVVFSGQSYRYDVTLWSRGVNRPDEFPVRARFPDLTDLYYRWDVVRSGTQDYELFDDSFDYYFGSHWLGTFNEQGPVRRKIKDMGKWHDAKPLDKVAAPVKLWKTKVTLEPSPTGPEAWSLRLKLQAAQ
ncbi:MAG: Ig-like domain-containing protein [Planctomycetota bacterium]